MKAKASPLSCKHINRVYRVGQPHGHTNIPFHEVGNTFRCILCVMNVQYGFISISLVAVHSANLSSH